MTDRPADVWVLLDHEDGALSKVSLQLLTAARSLAGQAGGSPVAVFCGTGWERAKEAVARYGAAKALVSESKDFGSYQPAALVETLAAVVGERTPWGVLFASGPAGKEVAARTGARLGLGVLADAISVSLDDGRRPLVEHAAFGGAVIVRKTLRSAPYLICLKANAVAFGMAAMASASGASIMRSWLEGGPSGGCSEMQPTQRALQAVLAGMAPSSRA